MKFKFLIFLCVFFSFQLQAQVDKSEKKSIRIPAKETKDKKDSTTTKTIKPKDIKVGLTKENKNKISGLTVKQNEYDFNKPNEEFSMFNPNKLKHAGELFAERWEKKAVESGMKIESMSDQFLGEYKIKTEFVNIICRDHGYPDGDLVRIFINEEIIVPRLLLTTGYRRIKVTLSNGINKIDFLALNQGDSGPNTAQFIVYDDQGNLVSSKSWNLLTGVKATIVFINEKNEK